MNQPMRNIFPTIRNVRHTPFVAHDDVRLVYSPELIKTIYARRYYNNEPWQRIADDLNIDVNHVRTAFAKGRLLKINPAWASHKPAVEYETVYVEPPKPKVVAAAPPKESKGRPHIWPDDLVRWVVSQTILNKQRPITLTRSLNEYFAPEPAPAYPTIITWVNGEGRAQTLQPSAEALDFYPLYQPAAKPPKPGRPVKAKLMKVEPKPLPKTKLSVSHRISNTVERANERAEVRARGRAFLKRLALA